MENALGRAAEMLWVAHGKCFGSRGENALGRDVNHLGSTLLNLSLSCWGACGITQAVIQTTKLICYYESENYRCQPLRFNLTGIKMGIPINLNFLKNKVSR